MPLPPAAILRFLVAFFALACAGTAYAETPRRVVSFNLCADQLVVALADPDQIAALSPYATDRNLSVVAGEARAFRSIDWQAESTILLKPDLVLVGPNDRSVTRRMLTRQGLRVVEVDLVSDLAAARAQIRDVAALLGHPERGEQLLAMLEAARMKLQQTPRPPFKTALVIERGGYAQGPQSLAATLLAEAGFKAPAGAPAGYGGFIPLEKLLMLRADVMFIKDPPREPGDQGALYFTHPALQALYSPARRVALPARYTMCGGSALVAAFDYLADALSKLAARF
jgi:iron complex transport system substrate-binding protein